MMNTCIKAPSTVKSSICIVVCAGMNCHLMLTDYREPIGKYLLKALGDITQGQVIYYQYIPKSVLYFISYCHGNHVILGVLYRAERTGFPW